MNQDLEQLHELHAIPSHVSFHLGQGGMIFAVVNNRYASAVLTLVGGHVMTYTPHGQKPVLWMSPNAAYQIGKAMRGGVPVCWPWFAVHPTEGAAKPLHGLVRTMQWEVAGTQALPDGATEIRLAVCDDERTRAVWPHAFALELTVRVGSRLTVEWTARNPTGQPYSYTGALHPYFQVSDIRAITIHGLDGVDYLDKLEDFQRKHQDGSLKIDGWTDRVYLDTTSDLEIQDAGYRRSIKIHKLHSQTTVVWNPDIHDAEMSDVGPGQHRHFVCVESANAASEVITVAPGGEARLGMEMWSEGWGQS